MMERAIGDIEGVSRILGKGLILCPIFCLVYFGNYWQGVKEKCLMALLISGSEQELDATLPH